MYIDSIEWLDKDNKEAILGISNNKDILRCFSCPCDYKIGEIINFPLKCLDSNNIMISSEKIFIIQRINSIFSYNLCGQLVDKKKGIIFLEGFTLQIDGSLIPKDINNQDYILFTVSRIDVW